VRKRGLTEWGRVHSAVRAGCVRADRARANATANATANAPGPGLVPFGGQGKHLEKSVGALRLQACHNLVWLCLWDHGAGGGVWVGQRAEGRGQ
jgi:hypothetical protein